MKRFVCAISAGALVMAVAVAYGQGKKGEESKSSASQSSSSSSSSSSRSSSSQWVGRSSSSQSSTSRSQGSHSFGSSGRSQGGQSPSSSRNQGGSQYGAPSRSQGGSSQSGQSRSQGSQQFGAPSRNQGGGQQYGAPSRGQRTENSGFGSTYRGQDKSGSTGQNPPPTKADNPPPRGQGQGGDSKGNVPPPRGQGGDKGTPPASDGGKGSPPVNQGPPTRTDSGGGKSTPPRPVGPPVQTDTKPKLGGGTVNVGRPKTGPVFDSRTGGIKPSDKNHNIVGPPTKIGPGSGVTIRDGLGRGFDGRGEIPRPTVIVNDGRGRDLNSSGFRWKVLRHEDYRSSLRYGYCHSNINWCDWWFGYRYYYFDPTPYNCVFSPYYGYYCVPGYISLVRCWFGKVVVIVVYGDPYRWNYCGRGTSYNFYSTYYEGNQGGNFTPLDRALSNLSDAFKYGDEKLLDRIVDRGSEIQVFIDNDYAYTMSSDDYFDITSDLIKSVQTTNFSIVQVKRSQEGGYVAVARHDYRDTWNVEQTNWLTFTFRENRGQYFLTQAGTAKSRPNF